MIEYYLYEVYKIISMLEYFVVLHIFLYLHDKSFKRYAVVAVSVAVVKFKIVMEYERRLHVSRHCYSDCSSPCGIRVHNGLRICVRKVQPVPGE